MRAHLLKFLGAIRSSYWFVPAVMALAACGLAVGTTAADALFWEDLSARVGWFSLETPDGARAILSTIAGSMITVAGVTFSITIAALAYATSQLGPRLLRNFMRDRGNQVTLGSFIATFVYCLLVLRAVRGDGEAGGPEVFVPHISVLTALALTFFSLAVLIYFIHHTPMSIHASRVVAQVGEELLAKVDVMFPFPADVDDGEAPAVTEAAPPPDGEGARIRAGNSGYVIQRDDDALLGLAEGHDTVLHLVRRPGEFVGAGEVLATAAATLPDAACQEIARCFALGHERTHAQDILLIVQQLVEIGARALSPGVNDPFTAMRCLDWLGSGLIAAGRPRPRGAALCDGSGNLRLIAPPLEFADIARGALDEFRPYASTDRNTALHMVAVIGRVLDYVAHPSYRAELLGQARALADAAQEALTHERDRHLVGTAHALMAARHA